MVLTSDIRSELVDKPKSHVSKLGTVVVASPPPCRLALASGMDFLSFPQVFGDQPWHAWQGLEASKLACPRCIPAVCVNA